MELHALKSADSPVSLLDHPGVMQMCVIHMHTSPRTQDQHIHARVCLPGFPCWH